MPTLSAFSFCLSTEAAIAPWTNRITACRRWTKPIACVLNGLFSTVFFPTASPACALSVPCTDVFFFAAGPACAVSAPCTDP
ncbi:hypothetical protein PC116_g17325 [Phytophthora cactorum]|nr:hypothetical protein Pcac1_g21257 [Phytophthora cactorum]KAG4234501.1 hypothetical protein PC116_g17325 [Phytophthora cactorum]